MLRGALGSRYGISPLGRGVIRPAAGRWWLSGGISADNCVAAFQPIGAASYAASKVNLTGDTDIYMTDGTYYPTWAAETGWTFSTSKLLFFTGINVPKDQTWTFIGRYANQGAASSGGIFTNNAISGFTIVVNPRRSTVDTTRYSYGTTAENKGAYASSGVIALAGRQGYLNGSTDGTPLPEYSEVGTSVLTMGSLKNGGNYPWNGDAIAVAVYNTILSSTKISALTTAMNAL